MKPRDVELLSSYLDGQLSPSDSARLEARIKSEPELVSVMDDLRAARGLLRKLPLRRAPRNFTLTRKMVGQNPPLPRSYPVFRFATALATLLFFLTYGLNFLAPQFTSQPVYGMGGGGAGDTELFSAEAPALEAPAATEIPATEAPAAPELALPQPTMVAPVAPAEDATREMETPFAKNGETGNALPQEEPQAQQPQEVAPLVPSTWQIVLVGIAFIGTVLMVLTRQRAIKRWK